MKTKATRMPKNITRDVEEALLLDADLDDVQHEADVEFFSRMRDVKRGTLSLAMEVDLSN